LPPPSRSQLAVAVGLLALLGAAVALRLTLLTGSGWLLEGDDSLSTLMGLAVLDGDRPIMLKNQTYAAAWEPYAMAVSYALFGISRVSAKLPALLGSLALIGSTWLLARVAVGRSAAWFAAVFAAIPPAYVLVLTLKPWAPYTEVIIGGSLALACALRLAWPTAGQRDWVWSMLCGIAAGLALWMHPLAIWYLGAALVTLAARVRGRRWLTIAVAGLVGFGLGGLPIWIFNMRTDGATLAFIRGGTAGQTADREAVFWAWWANDVPRGAGLWHPWGESPVWLGQVMVVVVGAAVLWAIVGRRRPGPRPLDALLVFLALVPLVLVFSGFGGPILNPYGFDATGRYTPPIWYALAVVLAAACAALWRVRRWLGIVACAVPLAINLSGGLAIDPAQAFQSPYWAKLPVDNQPLLDMLAAEGVDGVWLNHWAGLPLMFDARARGAPLVTYDWYDVQAGGIDRYPEYYARVAEAKRPAFVLVTDEVDPELARRLRALDVSYVEQRVGPYVVVIPTSRRVLPAEVTGALDYRY
jgi:4-amino-4-deoxy-L-arabinose transferase-like glycosyltransferase